MDEIIWKVELETDTENGYMDITGGREGLEELRGWIDIYKHYV